MLFSNLEVEVTENLDLFIADKPLHRKLKISLITGDLSGDIKRVIELIKLLSESLTFLETITYFLDREQLTDIEFYTMAGISRQTWHNIATFKTPKRDTIYKAIFALDLNYPEATVLLNNAGYEMDWSSKRNLVIIFCIIHKHFDPSTIDRLLNQVNEKCLFSEE